MFSEQKPFLLSTILALAAPFGASVLARARPPPRRQHAMQSPAIW
jgi:hypothetical protein